MGWTDLGPDTTYVWRTYVSNRTGIIDLHAVTTTMWKVTLSYYENGSLTPTRVKNIYIQKITP